MVKITDLEEKKLIIAYHKCGSNKNCKNIFVNSGIYAKWLEWWKSDFTINEKCIQMYKQKLILSGAKWRQGIRPQEYEERTEFLTSITDWINSTYDKKLGRKGNRKAFHRMLIELRERQLNNLSIEASKIGCTIKDISSKNELELRTYNLIRNGEIVASGTYESLLLYVVKEV